MEYALIIALVLAAIAVAYFLTKKPKSKPLAVATVKGTKES